MYTPEFKNILTAQLAGLKEEGLYKEERFIASQQYSQVTLKEGRSVINMCANNYLGLASDPRVIAAARGTGPGRPDLAGSERPRFSADEKDPLHPGLLRRRAGRFRLFTISCNISLFRARVCSFSNLAADSVDTACVLVKTASPGVPSITSSLLSSPLPLISTIISEYSISSSR